MCVCVDPQDLRHKSRQCGTHSNFSVCCRRPAKTLPGPPNSQATAGSRARTNQRTSDTSTYMQFGRSRKRRARCIGTEMKNFFEPLLNAHPGPAAVGALGPDPPSLSARRPRTHPARRPRGMRDQKTIRTIRQSKPQKTVQNKR